MWTADILGGANRLWSNRTALEAPSRVVGEPSRDLAVAPHAVILERLRKVPVVQREEGVDPILSRPDQPAVKTGPPSFDPFASLGLTRSHDTERPYESTPRSTNMRREYGHRW